MSDFSDHDISGLNNKLTTFITTLTPGERKVFSGALEAARDGLANSDVAGFDGREGADLLTKINWDALITMSVSPTNPVGDRQLGGPNN